MNTPNSKARRSLETAFADGGVRGAVVFLNSLTPHRFTSIYRFDGPTLRNVTFFDSLHPDEESCEDIPVEASYCVFVRDTGTKFSFGDSMRDERVHHHPKRNTVQRYCGVPLLDRDGKMFGSICHFDLEPGEITTHDIDLLEQMSQLLQQECGGLTVAE